MRIAALYDIHANLPALEAVLDEIRTLDVDQILIGGDVVPGPMPRETLDRLMRLDWPARFIRGNGDREILALLEGREMTTVPAAFASVMHWVADELGPDDALRFSQWPPTATIDVPALGRVLFCHATPRNDTDIFTDETPESVLRPLFEQTGASVVVCGHTHMPFDRRIGRVRVVNAGSVGMPFGPSGADWLLLGPEVELRHTAYDLDAAAARIRASTYPQAEPFAAVNVLNPPSARETIERFRRVELS